MIRGGLAACLLAMLAAAPATAQDAGDDHFPDRFTFLGQVQPRPARAIAANRWSVGTEAIDRDYSTYAKWAPYLGPLGAKHARLQSGWYRTDQGQGRYDYRWLDPIVDGIRAQGVQPWLSLSYGNPRYPGGGTLRRDTPLPSGAGLAAWLAYVRTTVARYRGRIDEFELWNEPNINANITAEGYAAFARETERAIRSANPAARIIFGAFAGAPWPGNFDDRTPESRARSPQFAKTALETYYRLGGRAEALTYHGYTVNPDTVYPDVERLLSGVHAIDPRIEVRQGENGAPSLNQPSYAFRNIWWTEQSQAKWMLRRMLGDAGRGIPTSVFTLTEMHYPTEAESNLAFVGGRAALTAASAKHSKGLLETRRYAPGTPDDDRTVVRTKTIYPAVQAVTAIFDSRLTAAGTCRVTGASAVTSAFVFRRADGAMAIAVWRSADMPDRNTLHETVDVRCPGAGFRNPPVYVDLLTRAAYATKSVVRTDDGAIVANDLPIYDAPVLLVDPALVEAR